MSLTTRTAAPKDKIITAPIIAQSLNANTKEFSQNDALAHLVLQQESILKTLRHMRKDQLKRRSFTAAFSTAMNYVSNSVGNALQYAMQNANFCCNTTTTAIDDDNYAIDLEAGENTSAEHY